MKLLSWANSLINRALLPSGSKAPEKVLINDLSFDYYSCITLLVPDTLIELWAISLNSTNS